MDQSFRAVPNTPPWEVGNSRAPTHLGHVARVAPRPPGPVQKSNPSLGHEATVVKVGRVLEQDLDVSIDHGTLGELAGGGS